MKRITFFILLACLLTIYGCRRDKFTYVEIHVNGNNPDVITQFSSLYYTDLGVTATDQDGVSCSVTVTGTVNLNNAGIDTISYIATALSGDSKKRERIVIVDGAQFIFGNYFVVDFNDTISTGNSNDTINKDIQFHNSVYFKNFSGYNNCNLHGLTVDSTLSIPSQTIYCGSTATDRTFTGSGVYSKDFTSFTIYYTETTNSVTKNGHCIYTKN